MDNNVLKQCLKTAQSLEDVFSIVGQHYDIKKPLGGIAKALIIANIDTLIAVSGAKPKK